MEVWHFSDLLRKIYIMGYTHHLLKWLSMLFESLITTDARVHLYPDKRFTLCTHKHQSRVSFVLNAQYSQVPLTYSNSWNLPFVNLFNQAALPAVFSILGRVHWNLSLSAQLLTPSCQNWICMTRRIQFRSASFKPGWLIINGKFLKHWFSFKAHWWKDSYFMWKEIQQFKDKVKQEPTLILTGPDEKRLGLGVVNKTSMALKRTSKDPDISIWWKFQILYQNKPKGGKHQDPTQERMCC